MKQSKINPSRIIVPGEFNIGNEAILKIYFRAFSKGHGNDYPPVIVTRINEFDRFREFLEDERFGFPRWEKPGLKNILEPGTLEARRQDYQTLFSVLKSHPYVLLDGNHRTCAAALTHRKISALEVESDEDLNEVRRMVEEGKLFSFNNDETDIYNLKRSFVAYCLNLNVRECDGNITFPSTCKSYLKYTKSVSQRVEDLVSAKELPGYMIKHYLERRGDRR